MMTFEEWLERPNDFREEQECPCCGKVAPCRRYHRGTAYCEDDLNYDFGCEECENEDREFWKELWDEYYAGRL